MTQASRTMCPHNATQQVYVPGRSITCIQCGAQIQPTPRAVNAGAQLVASEQQVNAAYPGDVKTADTQWAFAQ